MMRHYALYAVASVLAGWAPSSLSAQNTTAAQIANLTQDVQALKQTVGKLQLQIEARDRQIKALQSSMQNLLEQHNDLVSAYNASLEANQKSLTALRTELRAADAAQNEAIIKEVTRQIETLAKQTQEALDQLANAIGNQPGQVQPEVVFSNDYPEKGVAYTVKSGDTLSGIARRLNSTVKDIQNANKIVDPSRDLRVGDVIFVPQGEE